MDGKSYPVNQPQQWIEAGAACFFWTQSDDDSRIFSQEKAEAAVTTFLSEGSGNAREQSALHEAFPKMPPSHCAGKTDTLPIKVTLKR
jgi:hypothetical protein